jgi:uncharacterized protein YggL (DUF469 family)
VSYKLRARLSPDEAAGFLFRFLEQAIEANNLSCGGGGRGESWEYCVGFAGRGSPTAEQRAAVGTWLAGQPEVLRYKSGYVLRCLARP